jgi:hypothetical protein
MPVQPAGGVPSRLSGGWKRSQGSCAEHLWLVGGGQQRWWSGLRLLLASCWVLEIGRWRPHSALPGPGSDHTKLWFGTKASRPVKCTVRPGAGLGNVVHSKHFSRHALLNPLLEHCAARAGLVASCRLGVASAMWPAARADGMQVSTVEVASCAWHAVK